MLIPHLFLPSATLILTFLKCLHPASSQTAPQFNPSPSPAATSSLPTASSPTDTSSYNFTYPIFPDHDNSGISVSYKDTIDVSWISNGVEHVPVLQIQCWNRNDSSSFICASYIYPTTFTTTPIPPLQALTTIPNRDSTN